MNLPRWSLRYPVTAGMLFLCVVLVGVLCAPRLQLAFLPEVDFPGLEIQIPYPNALPAQVELTYEDTAGAFNPLAYTARPGKIGGLGVLLTRELTAAREYAYLFGRNRIRLALGR